MEAFKVYLCKDADGNLLFLQIAKDNSAENSAILEKSAYTLRELQRYADQIEQVHSENNSGKTVGYDRFFPQVVQSERAGEDQGNRMVNILSIKMDPRDPTGIDSMIPLAKIPASSQKVDEKTSAWIMGRFLKLLAFLHHVGIGIDITPENVLLSGPEQYHNIVLFDWSKALFANMSLLPASWIGNVRSAAQTTLQLLDAAEGSSPTPEYDAFLTMLARKTFVELSKHFGDSHEVHREFYELIGRLWGSNYHPMTIIPK